MKQPRDRNGNTVSLRDYIETIFAERETSAEFKRVALQEKVNEAKITTATAMQEAKDSVENRLLEAKIAADERGLVLQARIEKLESGGAPFASRLDEGMTKLQADVATLNSGAVRAEVVEALRARQEEDSQTQRRQLRLTGFAAITSFAISLVLLAIQGLK